MLVETVTKNHYLELIEVWEASVRATHHFLSEEDITSLKPLILAHYFDAVDLRLVKNKENKIMGFIGVAATNVEMLFIAPQYQNQGIGTLLLKYAINHQQAQKVDVNEQNPDAVGFYQHLGFNIIGRSPLDGQGNPFPLLHMALSKT